MKNAIAVVLLSVVFAGLGTVAVLWWLEPPKAGHGSYPANYNYGSLDFKDDVATNFDPAGKLPLEFRDRDGQAVRLADYRGKKNVALIVMRGITQFPGGVCVPCSTQTSRLAANHAEFTRRDTQVLVVFPGPKSDADKFLAQVQGEGATAALPFPVLIDDGFKAIQQLGIEDDAAKPSTFLLDKTGQVRFAYVGVTSTDRPSMKALYQQLDALANH